jgi:hypothetical protein
VGMQLALLIDRTNVLNFSGQGLGVVVFTPTSRLEVEPDDDLFDRLRDLGAEIPGDVRVAVDIATAGAHHTDPYGKPLKWATAMDIGRVVRWMDELSDWNHAVWAMICTLHSSTRIVLYWY